MPVLPLALVAFAVGTVLLQWQPRCRRRASWIAAGGGARADWLDLLRDRLGPACRDANHRGLFTVVRQPARSASATRPGARRCASPMRCPRSGRARTSRWSASSTIFRRLRPRYALRFCGRAHGNREAHRCRELSLAWYAQRQKDGDVDDVPDLVAGRALATRRSPEAAARHGQSARLRRRSLAARERHSRDRLRAQRRSQLAAGRFRRPRLGLRASRARRQSARASSPRCRTRRMRA